MTPQPQARTSRTRGQQGFTLVELIMATMVFAIGMVAVLGSIVAIMNNHRITATKHQAYVELQNQYEALQFVVQANGVNTNIGNVSLPGLPGSTLTLHIPDPVDPTTLYPLPLNNTTFQNVYGGVQPTPFEVVFRADVPTSPNSNTMYRFQITTFFP